MQIFFIRKKIKSTVIYFYLKRIESNKILFEFEKKNNLKNKKKI